MPRKNVKATAGARTSKKKLTEATKAEMILQGKKKPTKKAKKK